MSKHAPWDCGTYAQDVIPDEAFRRLRGALFFGPAFRVTRNKREAWLPGCCVANSRFGSCLLQQSGAHLAKLAVALVLHSPLLLAHLAPSPPLSHPVLFRDNLTEVLAGAVPGERQMEAKFKQWLQRCHATLDKSVRFEVLADARTQVWKAGSVGVPGVSRSCWGGCIVL